MGKKRNLSTKIHSLLEMFPVVAIVGPRQCGKSTFVKDAFSSWKYYDLEDPDHYQLITENPKNFFELNSNQIIIDEAQLYPKLFSILRSVIDKDRSKKGRFILTASSSPEIVKGLNESLAGRISTIEMWPLKINENIELENPDFYNLVFSKNFKNEVTKLTPVSKLEEVFNNWFKGSFPEPLIESQENPNFLTQWYQNYINSYVKRDIRDLFPRLNIQNFQRFLNCLAQYAGHQINLTNIARALDISVTTVKDYLDIIHQTFIWRNLQSFEKNLLKKVQKAPKGHFRDQGILHSLLKIQSLDDLLIHPIAGYSFEAFCVEEIIRGIESTMATQVDFNFYRTIDKSEIDLIIDSPSGFIPVEIKLGSTVNQRQLKSLKNFINDTKSSFGILVNTSNRIEQLSENIYQVPITYL